jgi:hypothetical protein
MKSNRKLTTWTALAAAIAIAVMSAGCDYVVPPLEGTPTLYIEDSGWAGIVNNVTESNGALHVDLSIVNNTNQWSAMDVGASTAKVVDSNGTSHDCGTVFVGTSVFVNNGGWYLAPGFVMKGYTGGTKSSPVKQLLYVECAGVGKAGGQKLSISYKYISGDFNYYVATRPVFDTMDLKLDDVATDTQYPVAHKLDDLPIIKVGEALVAINKCTVTLVEARRTDEGLEFDWASTNPTEYQAYVHIGIPPVIGSDGILYGIYDSPHYATVPITKAGGEAKWSTKQAVPKDVTGLYVLLPLESRQQKYFTDYVVDVTDL